MAGNEWINGYLEAILDAGAGIDDHRSLLPIRERGHFNPTEYFVKEVVTGYDETDIHRTWMKTIAMRNTQERNTRLENLCWRIWHLNRRKKKIEWEDAQRLARRHIEREQGHRDAAEELSEEFSEGEKVESDLANSGAAPKLSRMFSLLDVSNVEQHQNKCLYVVLISVHGLVRGENMELGRDSDTGGQVKYVVEFAKALAMMPEVYRVDLLTRQFSAPEVDWSYGEPTEMLTLGTSESDMHGAGESSGAYIVRIPCGPRDKYIHKELLWPHIQEFVDAALSHILNMAKVLGEQVNGGEKYVWPHVIHGHYADAGDIAALLSGALNVPMVLTGHSLGRNKLEQLLKQGRQSKEDINATYKIMRRIEAEELSLDAAELVITSTQQEIEEQWGLYDGFDVKLERVLRARSKRGVSSHGRYMPRMVVMPPGMDFSNMIAPDAGEAADSELDPAALPSADPISPQPEPPIWSEIRRFFSNPHKPMILALARPDPKKNITTLVKAFGECRPLRDLANLTLIMGNRDDIDDMSGGNANVLTTLLKLIDKYDLYGQVAYPKHHKQSDVPDIYRVAARTKGVFINPALVEPFGLTLIEAAAHGLPMVATRNGGPVDIHRALSNGLLVDPHDQTAVADALLKLVSDRHLWMECRRNGLRNIHLYSWPQHCRIYLARIALCRMRHPQWQDGSTANGELDEDSQTDSLRDVHDISLHLSVDEKILGNGTLENLVSQKPSYNGSAVNGSPPSNLKKNLENFRQGSLQEENETKLSSLGDKAAMSNGSSVQKIPMLRKKKRIFVLAVDSYDSMGKAGVGVLQVIGEILKSARQDLASARAPGFVLATAMTLSEAANVLSAGGLQMHEFDAVISSSGSEIYYPAVHSDEVSSISGLQFYEDPDYATHIDYRWGGEGLKRTIAKLLAIEGDKAGGKGEGAIIEDGKTANLHCLSYEVKDSSRVPRVDDLRKKLRMRGLRCHVIYCKNGRKLHVLPLLASRAQALRYLFVRWAAELSNMFVFVGETGDTDYEELLSGMHKTIILKGSVEGGCDNLLRGSGSYLKEDVVPLESPNIVTTEDSFICDSILRALKKL
eukprot:c28453_g1_i1 orf=396-3629(+)